MDLDVSLPGGERILRFSTDSKEQHTSIVTYEIAAFRVKEAHIGRSFERFAS